MQSGSLGSGDARPERPGGRSPSEPLQARGPRDTFLEHPGDAMMGREGLDSSLPCWAVWANSEPQHPG